MFKLTNSLVVFQKAFNVVYSLRLKAVKLKSNSTHNFSSNQNVSGTICESLHGILYDDITPGKK